MYDGRRTRVIAAAVKHFKKHDLDAYFIATNAPGRSAFNRVERRMAPLSRELTGLILDHQHFGSHLNSQNKTTDVELEKRNFQHAGEVLSEIWSSIEIDKFPVFAEYINPTDDSIAIVIENEEWYSEHVRESQYFLQIVKCNLESCCGKRRSSLWKFLPEGFLPPPLRIEQSHLGYTVVGPSQNEKKICLLLLQLA